MERKSVCECVTLEVWVSKRVNREKMLESVREKRLYTSGSTWFCCGDAI